MNLVELKSFVKDEINLKDLLEETLLAIEMYELTIKLLKSNSKLSYKQFEDVIINDPEVKQLDRRFLKFMELDNICDSYIGVIGNLKESDNWKINSEQQINYDFVNYELEFTLNRIKERGLF